MSDDLTPPCRLPHSELDFGIHLRIGIVRGFSASNLATDNRQARPGRDFETALKLCDSYCVQEEGRATPSINWTIHEIAITQAKPEFAIRSLRDHLQRSIKARSTRRTVAHFEKHLDKFIELSDSFNRSGSAKQFVAELYGQLDGLPKSKFSSSDARVIVRAIVTTRHAAILGRQGDANGVRKVYEQASQVIRRNGLPNGKIALAILLDGTKSFKDPDLAANALSELRQMLPRTLLRMDNRRLTEMYLKHQQARIEKNLRSSPATAKAIVDETVEFLDKVRNSIGGTTSVKFALTTVQQWDAYEKR